MCPDILKKGCAYVSVRLHVYVCICVCVCHIENYSRKLTKNYTDYNVTHHKRYLKSKFKWWHIEKRTENKILNNTDSCRVDSDGELGRGYQ